MKLVFSEARRERGLRYRRSSARPPPNQQHRGRFGDRRIAELVGEAAQLPSRRRCELRRNEERGDDAGPTHGHSGLGRWAEEWEEQLSRDCDGRFGFEMTNGSVCHNCACAVGLRSPD
jgi:hypothetical protein